MYQAEIVPGAWLQAEASSAYDFNIGDFTVLAMVQTTVGGPVVSRKGAAGGPNQGGFLLLINPDGSVSFVTDDGYAAFGAITGPTSVLDGDCHTVAGIRDGETLAVLVDGVIVPTTAIGRAYLCDVDNDLPLTVGYTQQSQNPVTQFVGRIMNVSLWSAALSGDDIVRAAFARVTGEEPELRGFWALDGATTDLSQHQNPLQIVGKVAFVYCLDCVWAQADPDFAYCGINNMPEPGAPAMTVTVSRELEVAASAPSLAFSVMANQDKPAFPKGVEVTLTDPSGTVLDQDVMTDTLYARTVDGQLWGLMATPPMPGIWRVAVTAPATTGFHLDFQTVPSGDVVETSNQALTPLYDVPPVQLVQRSKRSWLKKAAFLVGAVAVAAVVGVIAVAAIAILAPATLVLTALAVGVAAFAGTLVVEVDAALAVVAVTRSLSKSSEQVAGMAGFVVAPQMLLLMDAKVKADPATPLTYAARKEALYPRVTASSFNKVKKKLVGRKMQLKQVQKALGTLPAYVSASGHGLPFDLFGWTVPGSTDQLQEVLSTSGPAKIVPAQVAGKIFHFLACKTGYAGSEYHGLGRSLVEAGAVAFFGYDKEFIVVPKFPSASCKGDIRIDLELIAGATCADAHEAAIKQYDRTINGLRGQGYPDSAASIESNRNALVSPATDPMYGDPDAKLEIG